MPVTAIGRPAPRGRVGRACHAAAVTERRFYVRPEDAEAGRLVLRADEAAQRRMVGPFVLFDHMGPVDLPATVPYHASQMFGKNILALVTHLSFDTVEQMIENLNPTDAATVEGKNLHDIEVEANEPTVINLVNLIISTALRERASVFLRRRLLSMDMIANRPFPVPESIPEEL